MKRWRAKFLLLAGAAGLAFAIPALGQRDDASELPPGFGDPAAEPAPKEEPEAPAAETPAVPDPAAPEAPAAPPRGGGEALVIEDSAAEDLEDLAAQNLPPPIEIPEESRRPTDVVGPLSGDGWGFGYDAWGTAHGRLLSGLMGRLDAPLPSRWATIMLRRALLSHVPAPRLINEVDWVAERAWLLLRMGDAEGARALVQAVDVDRFTPRMFTVAVQTALATADPAGLCPLIGPGREQTDFPFWSLAEGICAALQGESGRAAQLVDQGRRRLGGGPDLLLAEKVVGAGTDSRRAVTIQWDEVDSLNTWRFGLASATGLKIPDKLLDGAGAHVRAWEAQAPMIPLDQRLAASHAAAAIGVFPHAALVEIYSLIYDATDPSDLEGTVADRLRRAYVAGKVGDRLSALENLWDDERAGADRYSRFLLTSSASAAIDPSEEEAGKAERLIASMFAAGLDGRAARWAGVVEGMGGDGDRAWAMLAVGTARPAVDLSAGRIEDFAESAGGHRGRMLVAALAGLGRFDDPASLGVDPAPRSRWAQMIALAARNGQDGTVALLTAVGMQTGGWRGVPPEHLYQMLRALRQTGREYEARMIAAEAMSRL
jgi:hypothetical protein